MAHAAASGVEGRLRTAPRVLLALVLLTAAVGVRIALEPWLDGTLSYSTVYIATLLTAWYCGIRLAVCVALLGFPAAQLLIAPQGDVDQVLTAGTIYFSLNTLIILLAGRYRRQRQEIKDAFARQRETVQRMQASFEHTMMGIAELSEELTLLTVNRALCRMLGLACEELSGRNILDFVAPDQVQHVSSMLRFRERGEATFEAQCVRQDGERIFVFAAACAVRDEQDRFQYWIVTFSDITDRKHAEYELRAARVSAERAKAAADQANREKDKFLAILSHELRTPLTPILAAVQLARRQNLPIDELKAVLDVIQRNTELEARLIDDLLDLTRIAQGKLVIELKPTYIETAIERAVEVAGPDLRARQLHFAMDMPNGTHSVMGDVSRLQQVFWNLLTNAIKFTPDGGCVGVKCYTSGDHVVVEVLDSGIGIEQGMTNRVFDAFEQGGIATTREFGGLGLGLSIAKRLVSMHGGFIEAHSEGRNLGATFRVGLPLTHERVRETVAVPVTPSHATSRRILLVDDNGDTATTMKLLLESFGYHVRDAGDVAQALRALKEADFDLLISDLGLPDGSGNEIIQEVRRRGRMMPAIALSGYGQEEDVKRSLESGFARYLVKPVDVYALLETVEGMFEETSAE